MVAVTVAGDPLLPNGANRFLAVRRLGCVSSRPRARAVAPAPCLPLPAVTTTPQPVKARARSNLQVVHLLLAWHLRGLWPRVSVPVAGICYGEKRFGTVPIIYSYAI